MNKVTQHLLSPIRFYLANPPKWFGTEDGQAVMDVYEMLFSHLNDKQLKYLATYYMTKVVPELMEGRTSTFRLQFPSPQELQEYLRRINKGQMDKRKGKEQEQLEKEKELQAHEARKQDKADIVKAEQALEQAHQFLEGKDEGKIQYLARQFRFKMINQPCEGMFWEITKKYHAADMICEIIKADRLEEFKETI